MFTSSSDIEMGASRQHQSEVPRLSVMNIDSIFEFGRTLGQGRFGVVIYAKDRSTGNEHAVKIISKRSAEGSTRHSRPLLRVKQAEREIMILQSINHPHIVHLQRVYDTREKLYMVMELCNGDLGKVFRDKSFTEDETRHVIQDLASAVSYLHKNDIVHRDLKLENILVAINPNDSSDYLYIKVIDFGLSIVKGGIGHEDMLQEFCGTVVYMAPELIAGKRYSHQCDVWAMGVILYHLLCGSFPFYSSNEVILCDMILKDKPSFSEQAWHETVSQEAAHLTNQMLTKDPAYRITASEVGNHPWVLSKKMSEIRMETILDMMKKWHEETCKGAADWVECEATKSVVTMSNASATCLEDDSREGTIVTTFSKCSFTQVGKEQYKKKISSKQTDTRKYSEERSSLAKSNTSGIGRRRDRSVSVSWKDNSDSKVEEAMKGKGTSRKSGNDRRKINDFKLKGGGSSKQSMTKKYYNKDSSVSRESISVSDEENQQLSPQPETSKRSVAVGVSRSEDKRDATCKITQKNAARRSLLRTGELDTAENHFKDLSDVESVDENCSNASSTSNPSTSTHKTIPHGRGRAAGFASTSNKMLDRTEKLSKKDKDKK